MIKCISFGKSLKQLFIIGLISCFTLLVGSSVNAWTYWGGTTGVNNDPIFGNWLIYQPVGDREYLNNYGLLVDEDGDFDTFYNTGYSQLVLYFPRSGQPYQYGQVYYGWIDGKLYYYGDYAGELNNNRYTTQGFIQNFCKTTKDLLLDVNNGPYNHCDYDLPAEDFYSQPHNFVNIFSMSSNGSTNAFVTSTYRTFCLEESNGIDVYCWSCSMYDNQNQTWSPYNCNSGLSGNLNLSITGFDDVFNIPYDFSPFGWSSGGNGSGNDFITIGLTGQDYIDYFENNPNYNFNKNICYVGTNDLITTGISGIPYYEGTGKNIVQLFAHLYGNTFTTKNLGSFLDTWNLNYGTWYLYGNRDELGNPLFNAYYTLTGGFYQDYSDNLTNPFLTNPTAVYFMASNISDYGNRSTLGEEISTYCYYKLQSENSSVFSGINLTDNHNSSINNNVGNFKRNWGNYNFTYSGENIQAMSWEGTDVDYFSGDSDLSFEDFFTNAFNKFKDSFSIRNEDLGAGFLPTYIIMFLLALVLFRFISH